MVKGKFCCDEMQFHISANELEFNYSPQHREFAISYKEEFGGGQQLINCCPWCGAKLSRSVSDEYFEILEKEYGIEDPYLDEDKVPEEFKTDEWWKKRGL